MRERVNHSYVPVERARLTHPELVQKPEVQSIEHKLLWRLRKHKKKQI